MVTTSHRHAPAMFFALAASLSAAGVVAFSPPSIGVASGVAHQHGRSSPSPPPQLVSQPRLHTPICAAAFSIAASAATPTRRSATELTMAKGGVHGKTKRTLDANKKKKKKNPNRPTGKHRKTSKRDNPAGGGPSSSSSMGSRGGGARTEGKGTKESTKATSLISGGKKPGPPWQVMNEKDAKKNVDTEKDRRERVRLGLESSSAPQGAMKANASLSNRLLSETDRAMISWKRFNPDAAPSGLAFVGGYLGRDKPPSLGVPEVAFLGRSNVGKSSLLNRMVRVGAQGDSARVGKTPGATASVNLYALLGKGKRKAGETSVATGGAAAAEGKPILGLVDLPGFGYAKLSKTVKERVELAAERYLGDRRELALGVLLVDSRRTPNEDDRAVLAALYDMGVPLVVAATKSDKLSVNEAEQQMARIRDGLGLPDGQPLRVSGVTGEGVKDIWRIVLEACESRVKEVRRAIEEGQDDGGALRDVNFDQDEEEEEEDEWFEDDGEEEEGSLDEDYDEDDVFYEQGYDWVKSGGGTSSSTEDNEATGVDFYDRVYDDDDADDDDYVGGDANVFSNAREERIEEPVRASIVKSRAANQEKQKIENKALKLKNLRKVARGMVRRGEV